MIKEVYYLVGLHYVSGEYGISKQELIKGYSNETTDEILDYNLGDYFGEDTVKDDGSYIASDYCELIRVTSCRLVDEEDVETLKKYMYM